MDIEITDEVRAAFLYIMNQRYQEFNNTIPS